MNEMEKLEQQLTDCQTDMQNIAKKLEDETDAAKQSVYMDAFKAKKEEFDTISAKYRQAKTVLETLSEVETLRKEAAKDCTRNVNAKQVEVVKETGVQQVHDKAKTQQELCHFCLDFVRGKDLPVGVKDALRAQQEGPNMSIELPRSYQKVVSMRAKAYPQDFGGTASILSTDATGHPTDSGAIRTIDPNFIAELLKYEVYMPALYDLTRPVNVYNGRAKFPKLDQDGAGDQGGVTAYWDSEGDLIAQTKMNFLEENIVANRLSCISLISREALNRSAIDLEAELMTQFRNTARKKMSEAILYGTGAADQMPLGVLNTAGITEVDRLAPDSVEYKDLVNLQQAVRVMQRMGSRFVVADSAAGFLQGKTDNEGRPLFAENTALNMRLTLIGWPYLIHEYKNADPATLAYLGQKGDVIFGNWNNYMFGIEDNVRISRTVDRWFEYEMIGFKMVAHVAGKCIFPKAFAALK